MSSTPADPSVGFAAAAVAVVFFGSNFVFAKDVKLGDGVFFQWVMCIAIWMTSIPVLLSTGLFPTDTSEFGIAMTGGFLWTTGNMLCGPIIQLIGLGMGLLIWGSLNMLMGWASGTFGLFGLTAEYVEIPVLNYAGVCLAIVGLALYLQVKPSADGDSDEYEDDTPESDLTPTSLKEQLSPHPSHSLIRNRLKSFDSLTMSSTVPLPYLHDTAEHGNDGSNFVEIGIGSSTKGVLGEESGLQSHQHQNVLSPFRGHEQETKNSSTPGYQYKSVINGNDDNSSNVQEKGGGSVNIDTYTEVDVDPFAGLSRTSRRALGLVFAVIAGMLFGTSFNPSQYIIDQEADAIDGSGTRESTLTFVFPHYCGILLSSSLYFFAYCILKKHILGAQPYVAADVIVPGLLSGTFWGIANIAWFVANQNLGFSVSFPIITSGPGFIGALWGVFRFGEIKGRRNFVMLGSAFAVTLPALVMVGLSHGA